jgi:cysteine desulfurase
MPLRRVYLDHSATSPLDPAVLEEMLPYLQAGFGNASSVHFFGQQARGPVDRARHRVANLINARPAEIVFTSGGTEANNLAVRGFAMAAEAHGRHIITSAIEHPSVFNVGKDLGSRGWDVTYLPVYEEGIVRLGDLRREIRDDTVLISVMAANNEIGTLQPIQELGAFVREMRTGGRRICFHTDAVQAAGKMPLNVEEIGCDLLSVSAHKFHGPMGIGALYVRRGVRLHPQNIGGRQERQRRGGTEPVPLIIGFGKAAELAAERLPASARRFLALREKLEQGIAEMIPRSRLNGDRKLRLPNISNISFEGVEGEGLLINLDMGGIAVSTGSACSSGSLEPSRVISALGLPEGLARGAIRFSFGEANRPEDVDAVLSLLPGAVQNLRRLSARPGAGA